MTARRRVPVVLQTSQTECGLSSCVAVLGAHGVDESLASARSRYEAGRDGLSAGDLVRMLADRGMESKVYRVASAEALRACASPVILFWEQYHYLVLERIVGDRAFLMDPAYGRRVVSMAELEEGFSSIVIDARPGEDFTPSRAPLLAEWRSLPLRAPGMRAPLIAAAGLVLAGYAVTIGLPLLTQSIVDAFTGGAAPDIGGVVLLVLVAAVLFYVITLLRSVVLARLVRALGQHLMEKVFDRMMSLPFPYFSTRPAGELLYRLSSVNTVRDLLSTRVVQVVVDAGTLLSLSVYLAIVSPAVLLAALGVLALVVVLLALTASRIRTRLDTEIAYAASSQIVQLDAIASIESIKMAGSARSVVERWSTDYRRSMAALEGRMRLQLGAVGGVVACVQLFAPLLLLTVSLWQASRGEMTTGQAIAVQSVGGVLFASLSSLFGAYNEFVQTSRAVARIGDITETAPETSGGTRTRLDDASLELHDVGFRYSVSAPDSLSGLSLHLPAGSTTAVVGASGAGKSTLAAVLCTLYSPTTGRMLVGGVPSTEYDTDFLRSRIGYVPQTSTLHNGTLLDNLAMGSAMDPAEIERRCRAMGFLDFIDEMPMGYRTIVSSLGGNLSGGQRQRVAIARTLLRDPEILVMDEATSALDGVNERLVDEYVRDLGCTRILFAHRLSTIRDAQQVVVLAGGRIAQVGPHDELAAIDGPYRTLYPPLDGGASDGAAPDPARAAAAPMR
ncbi:peptidase domain-containing ABC transporter [Rathayibacter sp. AY1A3]|uniref:peptidase domain-containing ABC transporter n=1 Tax=Rathayibacter sp. AY1A3 TaxID=2080521 RepID=UPI000CE79452|nr:peptidase domain-containing ABC transporter [Rathayibacter sp. AY1A3]PPF30701.1 cytolysin B transporter [Rathayibacter sp. AY1A3]